MFASPVGNHVNFLKLIGRIQIEFWKGSVAPMLPFRQVRVLPTGQILSEVVSGLEKFGHYNVTVLCFTSPGDGPRSDPVEAVTLEDG